jgi:lysophospholipase L1-like esterase
VGWLARAVKTDHQENHRISGIACGSILPMKTILCFGDSNTWGALPGTEGARAPLADRWPSVMAATLNGETAAGGRSGAAGGTVSGSAPHADSRDGYHVIAEGLNGRTTVFEEPMSPGKSGIAALPMLLDTHAPLDLVIIMLGTNDTKNFFQVSAEQIARGMEVLVRAVAASDAGPVGEAGLGGGGERPTVTSSTAASARADASPASWPPVGPVPQLLIVAPAPIGTLDERMRPHFAPEARAREVSRGLAAAYRALTEETGAAFFDAGTVVGAGSDGVHLDIAGQRALGAALAEQVRGIMGG